MTFFVVSESGNYYLDICGASKEPGTKVLGYPLTKRKNQQFYLKDNHLYSADSGLVLDVNVSDGRVITSHLSNSPNQLWFFQDDGSIRNCFNQCLTLIKNKSNEKSGEIFVSIWDKLPTQKWRVVTIAET